MDSRQYRYAHDGKPKITWKVIRTEMCMTKTKIIWIVICIEMCMTKTYNDIDSHSYRDVHDGNLK